MFVIWFTDYNKVTCFKDNGTVYLWFCHKSSGSYVQLNPMYLILFSYLICLSFMYNKIGAFKDGEHKVR